MSNREEMERAAYIRQIFEKMLAKVDHEQDHDGRMEEAGEKMTDRLGEGWKEEADVEGVGFVEVKGEMQGRLDSCGDHEEDKMDEVGDEEGLGPAPDKPEPKKDARKDLLKKLFLEAFFE